MISRRSFNKKILTGLSCLFGAHWTMADRRSLPNVLIIGDSISIGYTPYVKQILEGKANVWHNIGNAQHTGTGLSRIHEWLGDEHWDVIHFNWGLWDLCYRDKEGRKDLINGVLTTGHKQYKNNLRKLVGILEDTGACLIWANTTPVPAGEPGRIQGSEMKYNKIAQKIMKTRDIVVNDLHGLIFEESYKYHKKSGDVHFTAEGYQVLAKQVSSAILSCLIENS